MRILYLLIAALALFIGVEAARARGAKPGGAPRREMVIGEPGETWVDAARRQGQVGPGDPLGTEAAPPRWMAVVQTERMMAAPPPDSANGGPDALPPDEVRRLLERYAPYTYLGAMLGAHDSTLVRWPSRSGPLQVWVQPRSAVADWRRDFVAPVRAAFATWSAAGGPVTFALVDDSTQADVHVTWVHAFAARSAGHPGTRQVASTLRVTSPAGWIVAANIAIAVHPPDAAEPYDIYTIQTAGLHEIGHLLGLDHSPNASDVMAPTASGQDRLSAADRSTLRALYALPPGRIQ